MMTKVKHKMSEVETVSNLEKLSWISRGVPLIVSIFAFVSIFVWQKNSEVLSSLEHPQVQVHIVSLKPLSNSNNSPILLTECGKEVEWRASLDELADFCSQGYPFCLNVTSYYGNFVYFNVFPSLFWLVGGIALVISTSVLWIWPYRYKGLKRMIVVNLPAPYRLLYLKRTFYCLLFLVIATVCAWVYYFDFRFWYIGLIVIPISFFIYGSFEQGKILYLTLSLVCLFLTLFFFKMLFISISNYPIAGITKVTPVYVHSSSSHQDGKTWMDYSILVKYMYCENVQYETIHLTTKKQRDISYIQELLEGDCSFPISQIGEIFVHETELIWMFILSLLGLVIFGLIGIWNIMLICKSGCEV